MTRRKMLQRGGLLLLVLGLAAAVWFGYTVVKVARRQLEMERQLQAWYLMTDIVADFVEAEGAWPRNWEELEATGARTGGWYSWPADAEEVRQFIVIDFEVEFTAEAVRSAPAMAPTHYLSEGRREDGLDGIAEAVESVLAGADD